jgi:ketosteroid isomerase-like protein
LNRKYKRISVRLQDLHVIVDGDTATALFRQHYRSDAFTSAGYKKLRLKREKDRWLIYRETAYPNKPPDWPS